MRACVPTTPLGQGALWFLIEPEAGLTVTMANRAMTLAEWEQYTTSPMAVRKRKPQTRLEALEEEIRNEALR